MLRRFPYGLTALGLAAALVLAAAPAAAGASSRGPGSTRLTGQLNGVSAPAGPG